VTRQQHVKRLVKVIPIVLTRPIGVNFINILRAAFLPIFFCQKIIIQTVTREKLQKAVLQEKFHAKC